MERTIIEQFNTAQDYLESKGYVVSASPNTKVRFASGTTYDWYIRNPEGQPCNLAPMSRVGVIALAIFQLSQEPGILPEQAAIIADAASKRADELSHEQRDIVLKMFQETWR